MSLHRQMQLIQLEDFAGSQRVRYYINSQKAARIGNRSAAIYFSNKARQWEDIRVKACQRLR